MQHEDTRAAMAFAGLSTWETWLHYGNMGGDTDFFGVDAYLHGLQPLELDDADILSQAVNELIDDTCPDEAHHCRAPYSWRPAFRAGPTTDPRDEFGDDVDNDPDLSGLHLADADLDDPDLPLLGFAEPLTRATFASRLLSGVDLASLTGRAGIPQPPGATAELLCDVLDAGRFARPARRDTA